MQGYLLCEEDFEVVPAVTRNMAILEVDEKVKNVLFTKKVSSDGTSIVLNFMFKTNKNFVTIKLNESASYNIVTTNNVNSYTLSVNGNPVTAPFAVNNNDELGIYIIRNTNNDATITLNGVVR